MDISLFTNTACPKCTIHTPREAYYFIPKLENQMIYFPNNPKKSLRLIFDKKNPDEYLPHEKEAFSSFQQYFSENRIELPDDWTESETRKCIQASNFNNKKTLEKMKSCINYKVPIKDFDSIKNILSSGLIYMHGLDCNYRPIIVIIVSRFVKIMDVYPIENFIYAIYVFINYLMKHIFIPGQVENWIMIADLSNVSFWKPPTKILKIFNFLQSKYLCRLSSLYIYGMNYILSMCWKIVKKLIDERTASKFNFISGQDDIKNIVLEKIHPTQLEQRFGGTAEDVGEEVEFPFFLPSDIYQIDERNEDQIITEDEYINLVNEDKLVTISPYIIDEGKINKNKNKEDIDINKSINDNIKIVFNEKGNPVYNNIEFFECGSKDYDKSINISLEQNSNNINNNSNEFSNDDDYNEKLINRKKNKIDGNIIEMKNSSDNGTREINTVFEINEDKTNYCKCQLCNIF